MKISLLINGNNIGKIPENFIIQKPVAKIEDKNQVRVGDHHSKPWIPREDEAIDKIRKDSSKDIATLATQKIQRASKAAQGHIRGSIEIDKIRVSIKWSSEEDECLRSIIRNNSSLRMRKIINIAAAALLRRTYQAVEKRVYKMVASEKKKAV